MRNKIFILFVTGLFTLLYMRAFDLTLVKGVKLRRIADDNRFFHKITFPARGMIYDHQGTRLVENVPLYAKIEGNPAALHPKLLQIDESEALSLLVDRPESVVMIDARRYPYGKATSALLGYLGFWESEEVGDNLTINQKVGKVGIEKQFEKRLQGKTGLQYFEVNAKGEIIRLSHEVEPIAGDNLTLTIDADLTNKAYALLDNRSGAVVVSDIESSGILAMVSSPGFDPSDLANALYDENKPLLNRALQVYPPGSVFKMMTALAGLESDKINASTVVLDTGSIKVGETSFGNWYFSSYGRTEGEVNLVKALQRSNDIYFYKIAQIIGPEAIAKMSRKFHLGITTGIELSGEKPGVIPSPSWKEERLGEKWYLGDTYHMGIGQGSVLTSPLQINLMTAAIARHGNWCKPRLESKSPLDCEDLEIDSGNLDLVISGMVAACDPGGTAFPFFTINQGASAGEKIACKTGTAEFGGQDERGRKNTHAWFTMFYPVAKPRIAITVFLESSKLNPYLEGSSDAAPIAKSIWEYAKK